MSRSIVSLNAVTVISMCYLCRSTTGGSKDIPLTSSNVQGPKKTSVLPVIGHRTLAAPSNTKHLFTQVSPVSVTAVPPSGTFDTLNLVYCWLVVNQVFLVIENDPLLDWLGEFPWDSLVVDPNLEVVCMHVQEVNMYACTVAMWRALNGKSALMKKWPYQAWPTFWSFRTMYMAVCSCSGFLVPLYTLCPCPTITIGIAHFVGFSHVK